MIRIAVLFLIPLIGLSGTNALAQRGPTTRIGAVTAAELAAKIRHDEAWFVNARTLSMTSRSYAERTPEQIATRAAGTGSPPAPSGNSLKSVVPWARGATRLAFDSSRLLWVSEDSYGATPGMNAIPDEMRFVASDGKSSLSVQHGQNGIEYLRTLDRAASTPVSTGMSWPCLSMPAGAPANRIRPRWTSLTTFGLGQSEEIERVATEDFVLNGTAVFEGVNCHVLRSPILGHRLYVSVKEQRVIGIALQAVPESKSAALSGAWAAISKLIAQPDADLRSDPDWYVGQPEAVRKRLAAECKARIWPLAVRSAEVHYSEHREVQPGCWMPARSVMRQWSVNRAGKEYLSSIITFDLDSIVVNEQLPDSAFEPPALEGTQVTDTRFERRVSYRFKKGITDEEVKALVNAAAVRGGRSTSAPARSGRGGATR